jgi:hypothetical protein
MHDWTDIHDAISWLNSLTSGSVELTTDSGEAFTLNLSAFFGGAVSDIRNYLPYFEWKSQDDSWLTLRCEDSYNNYYDNATISFYDATGQYHSQENVNEVIYYYDYYDMRDMGYLLDGPSGNHIANGVQPYFPDYTFNGIFPGMTRDKMNRLFE